MIGGNPREKRTPLHLQLVQAEFDGRLLGRAFRGIGRIGGGRGRRRHGLGLVIGLLDRRLGGGTHGGGADHRAELQLVQQDFHFPRGQFAGDDRPIDVGIAKIEVGIVKCRPELPGPRLEHLLRRAAFQLLPFAGFGVCVAPQKRCQHLARPRVGLVGKHEPKPNRRAGSTCPHPDLQLEFLDAPGGGEFVVQLKRGPLGPAFQNQTFRTIAPQPILRLPGVLQNLDLRFVVMTHDPVGSFVIEPLPILLRAQTARQQQDEAQSPAGREKSGLMREVYRHQRNL